MLSALKNDQSPLPLGVDRCPRSVYCSVVFFGCPRTSSEEETPSIMPAQIFYPPVLISGADAARDEVAFGHPMPMFLVRVEKEVETAPGADGGIG
mmetsp:Transcript_6169/g.10866  ORF Transcript_6169/g.10866 Transcript_6169/m.10866 type:complete len:95 (+) Transcript_6169:2-286(+)